MARLPVEAHEQATEEDEAMLQAESQIPVCTIWDISSTDLDDEDFTMPDSPDHEAGVSGSAAAATLGEPSQPPASTPQVSQSSEFSSILQHILRQQEEDRRRMDAIQREAARERAAAEERFAGLLDRVTQTTNAQLQQLQQGMTAMIGVMSQLVAHTGLQ